jgi:hypothetical protein
MEYLRCKCTQENGWGGEGEYAQRQVSEVTLYSYHLQQISPGWVIFLQLARPCVLCMCLFSGENCESLKISRCFFFNNKQQFNMFSTGSAWTSPGAATTCASAPQAIAARDASTSPVSGNSSYSLIFCISP